MKKLKYILFLLLLLPIFVNASTGDRINRIDVDIILDEKGNASITEIWDVYAGSGTEFYKAEYNLGNMEISNFKVKDENGREFTFIENWDIDASLSEKAYKNGFYYSSSGLELCWGKSSMGSHKYTITYDVSNFVFKTSDSQVAYWSILNKMEMMPKEFTATISSNNPFSDTLDVWGYGYKGYAYVNSGKIMMSNEENTHLSSGDYAVILIKFPIGAFDVEESNTYAKYENFDDVYKVAEKGTFEYNYDNEPSLLFKILGFISSLIAPFFIFLTFFLIIKSSQKYKFGPAGSKINMKDINMYRDIPCNKDIFRAFFIAQAYHLNSKNTDFFGSIFLKWLFENKIELRKETKTRLIGKDKEETSIILKDNVTFDTEVETTLYNYLKIASRDNILEKNEFTKWSNNNYNKLFKWFDNAEYYGRDLYVIDNLVSKEGSKHLISDNLKEEAIKLAGLKKFLIEFSRIKEKEAIEVMLWKEYLMYAQIFGIADKVAEQFEKLYPEVIENIAENQNISLVDIMIINDLSHAAVVSASSARSAAQSYSAGGGGFSSGGGGGGSFGGGGGGGR